MIYLRLFLTFLKIGAVSFGGGYGMISLIKDDCLANGWLDEDEILNLIAVAESTPGPIAVNMATFVGSSQAGFLGALLSTLGVVLPSFVIILLVAALLTQLMKYGSVKAVIRGVRPAIVALITGTALTMLLAVIFGVKSFYSVPVFDPAALILLVIIIAISFLYKRCTGKPVSPILLIILSGAMGVVMYGM